MCKHVPNAQVAIRTKCCHVWVDCPLCHDEKADHALNKTREMILACKKCKKVWRLDLGDLDEQDEYCPHCDNRFVLPAAPSKEDGGMAVEMEVRPDQIDSRLKPLSSRDRDERTEYSSEMNAESARASNWMLDRLTRM